MSACMQMMISNSFSCILIQISMQISSQASYQKYTCSDLDNVWALNRRQAIILSSDGLTY